MDSRTGLDYIVENKDYVAKLGSALDTSNHTVKKQVFELLSALCAYNVEGYTRALETLEHYTNLKSERYRLKLVVTELDNASAVDYQIALLAFINCVIISAPSLQKRIKIRNEFIGLDLLSVINNLRRVGQNVSDIKIQLDVFDEQRESDEAQNLQDPDGINLNSHLDVFYAILRQVADTPQGIPFLSILQHLLRIDPKEPISDLIWDTAETLLHRATLLENREDSVRLLRAPSIQKFTCPHCRADITGNRKQSLGGPLTPSAIPSSPPSFALPPGPSPAPPPPPPIPPPSLNEPLKAPPCNIPPPPPPFMSGTIPPPPPINKHQLNSVTNNASRPKTPEPSAMECTELLSQQETPMPKSKMKTINWNKIPSNKVMGKNNIWTMVATSQSGNKIKSDLDWTEIEGLFCQQPAPNTQGSPKLGRDKCDTLERKKKESSEINLLDGKRSLNVNIFLKQFRSSNEDIIQLIKNGEHDDIGAEKLRGLLKILPEIDELDMLKTFDGDKSRLGNAEKFLMDMMKLSNYKLRIECMLLKEEFAVNMGYLEPALRAMLYAGEDLMTNKALQEVLYMVIVTGNFLNSGGYAGNAAGVKLSSLQKLTDIRANKPGMNLIHFVALQTEKTNPELLKFPEQLTTLENASKTSVEQLNNELTTLDGRIKKIKKNIESAQTDADIKDQMMEFLQVAGREVAILQNYMKELDNLKIRLAEFFVEDVNSFKMEECYKIFQNFREKFRLAVVENDRRRYQEEQAAIRRKQREDQLAVKRRNLNLQLDSNSSMENNNFLLDPLQFPVSPAMQRRRMGSFNNNDLASPNNSNASPEGSLRRRKSRNLTEDETLMDFLRSSGHDNFSRERKTSYGSLDRSWARRNRPESGFRKRPDLFNVDFNGDRERSHSPSPVVESKELPGEEPKQPRISKEWHQKIQNWLQHNDSDGKQRSSVDYKKSRLSNRRSYEEDSESDRSKLDPLPEEPTRRASSKWQPSNALEGTDVVGTIEAIQEAQPKSKELSHGWTDSSNRLRRQLSREKCASPQLESILEENKRKLVIQQLGKSDDKENMELYIRRPIDIQKDNSSKDLKLTTSKSDHKIVTSPNNTQNIYVKSVDSGPHSISTYRSSQRRNKIDIDSDNIETPPVTRRSMSVTEKNTDVGDGKTLDNDTEIGNGQFDRFSSARKTRRYKRPTNLSPNTDDQSPGPVETPEKEKSSTKIYLDTKSPAIILEQPKFPSAEDKESRLKRWQERLKSLDPSDSINDNPTPTNTTTRSSSRKNISLINPEEVKEAVHYLQRSGRGSKISNNELNDEGFEESQSLVSDTPSQGKDNLSGTENNELSLMQKMKPIRMNSSESAITTTSNDSKSKTSSSSTTNRLKSVPASSAAPVRRSSSLKRTPSKPNLPTRQHSLRKNDSQTSISSQSRRNNNVEKSGSRNSLLSSRSSLNSAVSTNTVVRRSAPTKPTSSLFDATKKSSPTARLTSTLNNTSRIPASRSSSSNSSLSNSAPIRNTSSSTITNTGSTNPVTQTQLRRPTTSSSTTKEIGSSLNNRLATNNYPLKAPGQQNSSTNSISNSKVASNNPVSKQPTTTSSSISLAAMGGGGRHSNFMRPTTSSSTKSTPTPAPVKISRFR